MNIMSRIRLFLLNHPLFHAVYENGMAYWRKTNRFNVFNLVMLSGFFFPLAFLGDQSTASTPDNDKLCSPYRLTSSSCSQTLSINSSDKVMGIDVSHYQGDVTWDKVAASDLAFAITKATGGKDYTDPQFHQNWHEIRQQNLIRGAYHFFYAGDDVHAQVEHFLTTVGTFRSTDFPPILDIEITDQVDPNDLKSNALLWLQLVKQQTQRTPIIYTDASFAQEYLTDPKFGEYYLWLADYDNQQPPIPAPWKGKDWLLLQYTETGTAPGVTGNVDLNRYRGSLDDLRRIIQISNL